MSSYDELSHLDDEQRDAVTADIRPIYVNAGPGSGKTRVIVERIKHLIKYKIRRNEGILALTFTNKAALEMEQRVRESLASEYLNKNAIVQCCTFHSFCRQLLTEFGHNIGINKFSICTDTKKVIKKILKSELITKYIQNKNLHSEKIPIDQIISNISTAKRSIQNAQQFAKCVKNRKALKGYNATNSNANEIIAIYELSVKVYIEYERLLSAQKQMDFDDLMLKTMQLFQSNENVLDEISRSHKYAHIVIDEFQDTNSIQFEIAKTMTLHRYDMFNDHQSIMIVGDKDQTSSVCILCICPRISVLIHTVYSWRGSENTLIKLFKKTFSNCIEIRLHKNYRSTKCIQKVAQHVINSNNSSNGMNKKMTSIDDANGDKVLFEECKSDQDEANFVISKISEHYNEFQSKNKGKSYDLNDIAVLYRTSAQSRVIEEKLNRSKIKYVIAGGVSFYQRREILEILNFLRVIDNDKDDESLKELFKTCLPWFKGIGPKMIEKIIKYGKMQKKKLSFQQSLFRIQGMDNISQANIDKIKNFLKILIPLRKMRDNPNHTITDLMNKLLQLIEYENHLNKVIKNKNESAEKWQNIQEFVKIATEFDAEQSRKKFELENESDSADDSDADIIILPPKANHYKLDEFLQHIALCQPSSEDKNENNQTSNHPMCLLKGRVQLTTIHKAKGKEWKTVFVIGCSNGQLPHWRYIQMNDIEEERRLAFVAVTRAKKNLYLSYAKYRNDHQQQSNDNNNTNRRTQMSNFFIRMDEDFVDYRSAYDENKSNVKRLNVFVKKSYKNKKRKRDKIEKSIVEWSGFGKVNKFMNGNGGNSNAEDIQIGMERRAKKAKLVEKKAKGFQIASNITNNVKVKVKKNGFKPPRMIQKVARTEVEKVQNVTNKRKRTFVDVAYEDDDCKREQIEIKKPQKKKQRKMKRKKKLFAESDDDEKEIEIVKKPTKKKVKKKKKKTERDRGQTSILSYFGRQ